MTVGLLFGVFWLGLGVLMWWWPAAIFVAFNDEDVTPGARAFAVAAAFLGIFFVTMEVSALTAGFAPPATAALVGVLLLVKPVDVFGVDSEGLITPRRAGVSLSACGLVGAALTVV